MALDTFRCPQCQTTLRRPPQTVSPTGAAVQVRCPRCQAQFPVPPLESESAPPAPPPPPPPAPAVPRENITEAPQPAARPRFSEADDLAVTREPHAPVTLPGKGEYEDEDYPRRPRGFIDPSELPTEYTVDIGAWFSYGTAHWSTVVGPAAGFLVLVGLTYLPTSCISPLAMLMLYFVTLPMSAGLTLVCLKQLKGEAWTFGDFFGGFRHYSAFLLPNLVYLAPNLLSVILSLIPLMLMVSGQNPQVASIVVQVIQLLLLPVTVFVQIRFWTFSWHLILDRHYNGIEALKGTWQMTQGHFWILFALFLIEGLINLGGALGLCVGMLFTIPLTALINAAGYLLIAGTELPLKRPVDAFSREENEEIE